MEAIKVVKTAAEIAAEKEAKRKEEERIINIYKLKESIKARFKKIGDEDLADDIIEYINYLLF